ncbi:MAG: PIN domain-containing protein [Treponemataceae bacterium]|nr:PIN domain-containing protein [Treponemataceae bacterium]
MERLTLLIDTDVFLDVFFRRKPFEDVSKKIFEAGVLKKYNGIIAAHSFSNMFYVMRKNFEQADLRKILLNLTACFEIASLDKKKLITGLQRSDFPDFEDCLQDECASEVCADFIITRNTKDFRNSNVRALTPEEFLELKKM